jgi:hypothetical protein
VKQLLVAMALVGMLVLGLSTGAQGATLKQESVTFLTCELRAEVAQVLRTFAYHCERERDCGNVAGGARYLVELAQRLEAVTCMPLVVEPGVTPRAPSR